MNRTLEQDQSAKEEARFQLSQPGVHASDKELARAELKRRPPTGTSGKSTSDLVRESLEPLFARAERDGLWFYSCYQGIWLTPEALRAEQQNGRLRWGGANWELRDPKERVLEARRAADVACDQAAKIGAEYERWRAKR